MSESGCLQTTNRCSRANKKLTTRAGRTKIHCNTLCAGKLGRLTVSPCSIVHNVYQSQQSHDRARTSTNSRVRLTRGYLERFFRSLKSECLSRLILFGERSLRKAVKHYLSHYHTERCHQGLPSLGARNAEIWAIIACAIPAPSKSSNPKKLAE